MQELKKKELNMKEQNIKERKFGVIGKKLGAKKVPHMKKDQAERGEEEKIKESVITGQQQQSA